MTTEDPGVDLLSIHRNSVNKFHLPPLRGNSHSPSLILRSVDEVNRQSINYETRQSINYETRQSIVTDLPFKQTNGSENQSPVHEEANQSSGQPAESPIDRIAIHDPINRIISQAVTHINQSNNRLVITPHSNHSSGHLNNKAAVQQSNNQSNGQAINQINTNSSYLSAQNLHNEPSNSRSDLPLRQGEPTSPASMYESAQSPMAPSITYSVNQSHIPAISSSRAMSPSNQAVDKSINASANFSSSLSPPVDPARLWSRTDPNHGAQKVTPSITDQTYVHPATFPSSLYQTQSSDYSPPPTRSRARSSFSEADPIDSGNISAIHLVSLQFRRPEIEDKYQEFSHGRNDRESWQLSVLCAILYCIPFIALQGCFLIFDVRFVVIRLAVMMPILLMFYFRCSRDWFSTPLSSQHALAIIGLIFFFGENLDAFTSGNNQSLLDVGTPVFFFWILPAFHLKFPHALAVSLCAVVSRTACTTLLLLGAAYAEELVNLEYVDTYWAVQHEVIIWLVATISLAYCWQSERLERREFWYRNLLLQTVENNEILLQRMLPSSVIAKLQRGDSLIAEKYDHVSLIFVDLIGFQQMVATCSPVFVVHVLDAVFSLFDDLSEQYGVYKVETVFDTWVGACGIQDDEDMSLGPGERERARLLKTETKEEILFKQTMNATRIALLALAIVAWNDELELNMRHELSQWPLDHPMQEQPDPSLLSLRARVGIHSGPVVAGVIGRKLPRYRLFGDTVNTTARMCTHGAPGKVHCSPDIIAILQSSMLLPRLSFVDHATRLIKGKGHISTAYLNSDGVELTQQIVPVAPVTDSRVKIQYPNQLLASGPRTPELSKNLSFSGPNAAVVARRPSLSPSPSPRTTGRELAISRVLSATMAPRPTGKPFFAHQPNNQSVHPAVPFFSTTGTNPSEPTHVSFVDLVKHHTQLQTHDSFESWAARGSTSPSNKASGTGVPSNCASAETGMMLVGDSNGHNIPQRSRASTTHSSKQPKHIRGASQALEAHPNRFAAQQIDLGISEQLALGRSLSDGTTSNHVEQEHKQKQSNDELDLQSSLPYHGSKISEEKQNDSIVSNFSRRADHHIISSVPHYIVNNLPPSRRSARTLPIDKQPTDQVKLITKPFSSSSRGPPLFHGLRSYKSDQDLSHIPSETTDTVVHPQELWSNKVKNQMMNFPSVSEQHTMMNDSPVVRRKQIRPGHKRAVTLNDKHFDCVLGFTGFKAKFQSVNEAAANSPLIEHVHNEPRSARSHRMLRLTVNHSNQTPTNGSSPKRMIRQLSSNQSNVISAAPSKEQSTYPSTNPSARQSGKLSLGQSVLLSFNQSVNPLSHPHSANIAEDESANNLQPNKRSSKRYDNQCITLPGQLPNSSFVSQSSPTSLALPHDDARSSLSTANQTVTRSNTPPDHQPDSHSTTQIVQQIASEPESRQDAFSRSNQSAQVTEMKQDNHKQILHQSAQQASKHISNASGSKKSASVHPSDSFPNSSISSSPNQSINRSVVEELVFAKNDVLDYAINESIKQLDTDDLPFHMLDPETMKLDFALCFEDYPELEKNYSINRSNKLLKWVEYRIPAILLGHFIVITFDYVSRLIIDQNVDDSSGSYDGISGWTSQSINQSRFFIRLFAGSFPACLIVLMVRQMDWHLSTTAADETDKSTILSIFHSMSLYLRRRTRLHHWIFLACFLLSSSMLVSDTINQSNQSHETTIVRSSDQSNLSMDTWCVLIVLSGIASSMFHWPALISCFFVCSVMCEYVLMFMIVPSILHAFDGSISQNWSVLCEQLLFGLCMLALLYINARIAEVRSRGRFLTLLDLKKQRKDTASLLERLLPKQIIDQLLSMNGSTPSQFVAQSAVVDKTSRPKAPSVNRSNRRVSGSQWNFTPRVSHHSLNYPAHHHANALSSPSSALASPMAQSSTMVKTYQPSRLQKNMTIQHPNPPPNQPGNLLAQLYPSVTVMQADICHFTPLCARSTPQQVITMLNQLFLMFDSVTDQFGVYKVETIGDAVLAVCGAPVAQQSHACQMAQCALAARKALAHFTLAHDNNQPIKMRFGLHTGPVVGGVVGLKKMPRFHIYGRTVNQAGSMEQIAEPMTVAMSESTWKAIQQQDKEAHANYQTRRIIARRVTQNSSTHNSQQNSEDDTNTEEENDQEDEFESNITHSSIRSFYELIAYKDPHKDDTNSASPPVRPGTASRATRLTGNHMVRQHMELQLKHTRRNQSINDNN